MKKRVRTYRPPTRPPTQEEILERAERQHENTLSVMKTKRHARQRRSRVVPYGEDMVGDQHVPNPHEQEGIALMRRLRADGMSFRKIAAALIDAGYRPKYGGKKWACATVLFILRRVERIEREKTVAA